MSQLAKTFSLSACALAATLMISACGGGGGGTDIVAPTVAITDNVAGATATGPVTFTFTFSEDVGTSFTVEDLVVAGGTAGALAKTDATHYTLVVTPTGASGTVSVSLAANKFEDIAHNPNTAAATQSQAFAIANEPTTAPTAPTALAANVLSIYSDAYTPVAGVVLRPDWGQTTAVSEVTIAGNKVEKYTTFNYEGITFTPIDVTAMTKIHVDVWTPDLTSLDVFVLAGGAEQFVKVTPTLAGWNSFDIDLSAYTTLNKAAVKELKLVANGGSTAYLDNIYFWKPAGGGGAAGSGSTGTCTTAACVNFSGAGIGFGLFENNGGTVEIANDPKDGTNKVVKFVKKSADNDYFGTTITGISTPVLTAGAKTVTLRVLSPEVGTNMLLKFEGGAGGATTEKDAVTTKANEWETLSFVMPDAGTFTTVVLFPHGRSKVTADTAIYVDELNFPAVAGGGGGGGGTVGVTFDEATPPTFVGFNGAESSSIAAGPAGGSAKALKIVRIGGDPWAGAKVTGLSIALSAANPTITARVNSPAAGIPFVLKLEGGGTASAEKQASTAVVAGWQTLSWTFSGADLKNWTDLVFLPNLTHVAPAAPGETYYVDDITGVSIPAAGGGAVEMGAGGAQTLTIAAGDVKTGDGGNTMFVAGEGIFAVNYVGSAETTAPFNLAGWPGAKTANFTGITGVAGGNIGYFQDDVNLSTSTQKVDEGGWVAGTALSPNGVPSFFRYFVLKGAVSNNAYMGLYANAPNNGTVNTSGFSKIKFKVWGPGPMFERANFNPVLEMTLTGPKVAGCTTGSGGTEITQTFTANLKNGAGGSYTLPFAGFTVKGLCGADTNANAAANVRANLARVVMTVPGTSFNYTNLDGGNYATGVNLGPIGFTNN